MSLTHMLSRTAAHLALLMMLAHFSVSFWPPPSLAEPSLAQLIAESWCGHDHAGGGRSDHKPTADSGCPCHAATFRRKAGQMLNDCC